MKNIKSFNEAFQIALSLKKAIIAIAPVVRIEFAGSLRREEENIGDIDILVDIPLVSFNKVEGLTRVSGGNLRATFIWKQMQVDIWLVENNAWGNMLFAKTGPTQYFIAYAKKAQKLGMKLSMQGLVIADKLIPIKTEQEIYNILGKQYKEPKFRGK